MNEYDDIINLSRPKSKRPKLSASQRAAQFAPFATLTGYEDMINKEAEFSRIEKTENEEFIEDI